MNKLFSISRADGRSNQQVIIDLVHDGIPGTIYSYQMISEALQVGTEQKYPVRVVQSVVVQSQPRLLTEHNRTLMNLRGVGYKLAFAKEHAGLSLVRRRRADVQLKKGLELLRNVKWDELDENSRRAHEGTLLVTEALYANQRAIEKRQGAIEAAIAALTQRVNSTGHSSAQ